jgi:CRP-like cAMP-binding protein
MFMACDVSAEQVVSQLDFRQLLENLYRGRSLVSFTSGQTIPLHPQGLWVVCRGAVQLTLLYSNGEEALLGIAGPGMPFGSPLSRMHPYQAIALTDVDVMPLTLAEVECSPELTKGLYVHLTRRLSQTEALLAIAGHRRVEDRLRNLLQLLAQEFGQDQPDGTCLTIRLTHQHLANAIGTTRVTVTRLLGLFRQEGWLSVTRDRYLLFQQR